MAYALNLPGMAIVGLLVWLLVPEPDYEQGVGLGLLLAVVFSGAFYGWLWHRVNRGRLSVKPEHTGNDAHLDL